MLLGAGVTEADSIALPTPGTDDYARDAGVSVLAEGVAERLGRVKRFRWPFRRFIAYERCTLAAGDREAERGVQLASGATSRFELTVREATLFGGSPDEAPTFAPFLAADDEHGDGDGFVTLAELDRTPWAGARDPDGREWATLGERVYLGMLPHIVSFRETGTCSISSSAEEPDDGGPF